LIFIICFSFKPAQVNSFEVHGLEFPPYIMVKENGETHGIVVDMVRKLAVRLDQPVRFKISNWARAYRIVTQHESDALIPAMKTVERLEYLHYPETPLLYLNFYLISHKGNRYKFNGNFKELADYKVGRLRDAKVAPSFDKALSDGLFTVEQRNSTKMLVKAALLKRLDFIALDWRVSRWEELSQSQHQQLIAIEPALGKVPVYLAFSNIRYTVEDVSRINKHLSKMHNEHILEHLDVKYFGQNKK